MRDDKKFVPLAIVGMSCRFPKADNPRAFWSNIVEGRDCIEDIPESHWRPEDYFNADQKAPDRTYSQRGGFLDRVAFDPLEFSIPPTALEATDTSQLLGMLVAKEALADSGYLNEAKNLDRNKVSVILGVTGCLELVIPLGARLGHPLWRKALQEAGVADDAAEAIIEKIAAGYVPWQENSFPGLLGNVVAGRIANYLDLGGTNCVVDAACASSLSAMHLAALELASGRSDLVLTGGVDTFNDIFMYMCFSKTPALSPTGHARPFDKNGDGTSLGEGLGVVALKRLADAERDGDRIYSVIRSIGSSSDGKGSAIYAPVAKGQSKALREAYELAQVDPQTIELIEAHGTGTRVGDTTEVNGLKTVFDGADKARWCAVGSVKSQIGHTKAAAGVAGIIKATLALHRKVLPPTIKVTDPVEVLADPKSPFYVNDKARPWMPPAKHPRRAGVSAFGFGGSNFHAVLEEHGSIKQGADWDGRVQIAAFSGDSKTALKQALQAVELGEEPIDLEVACAATRKAFDVNHAQRLLFVVDGGAAKFQKIREQALQLLDRKSEAHWSTPDGIYYGSGDALGKLGILFPGQGAQYPGMLRDLVCRFPEALEVMIDVDRTLDEVVKGEGHALSDYIYPRGSTSKAEQSEQADRLRRTQVAQPAIGAVSVAAMEILGRFGLKTDAVGGHSFGELTALCISESVEKAAFYMLSRVRGRLMAAGEGDKGGMLAVRSPLDWVEQWLKKGDVNLVLANKNAPDQAVLAGSSEEIERAAKMLAKEGVTCKRLPVAAAFHSRFVADASAPFHAELSKVTFKPATLPVYANATGNRYPEDPQAMRDMLADQLQRPVAFVDQIREMYESGIRTFVEVGPGARLTGLVKSILKGENFEAFALDASSGKRSAMVDLARVLAHLSALGRPLNLNAWEDGGPTPRDTKKKRMTVYLSGANYKSPQTQKRAAEPVKVQVKPAVAAVQQAAPAAQMKSKAAPTAKPALQSAPTNPVSNPQPAVKPAAAAPSAKTMTVTSAPSQQRKVPVSMSSDRLSEVLAVTQANMQVLQKMQEETARLHLRYLEGQQAAQRNLSDLITAQQALLSGTPLHSNSGQPAQVPVQVPQPVVAAAPAPMAKAPTPAPQRPAAPQPVAKAPTPAPRPVAKASVAAPKPAAPAVSQDKIVATIMAVIAEKTGYPEEMLEANMSLDGDLGIDSIKRVEILSSVQDQLPELPAVAADEMGSLQTIDDVINYLAKQQGNAAPSVAAPTTAPAQPASQDAALVQRTLMQVVAEKTGYPEEMLEDSMSLDADLGIDSIKRVEILSSLQDALPQLPEVNPEVMGSLQTLGDILAYLGAQESAAPAAAAAQSSASLSADVQDAMFAIVAEKTGYPVEMLEANMSLDADLGIDSIKRVEILSALQDALPELPAVDASEMSALQTLGDIASYFEKQAADQGINTAPASAPVVSSVSNDAVLQALFAIVAEKTGYPEDMLEDSMALEGDLGIDSIKRVEILSALQDAVPGVGDIPADEAGALQTLGDIAAYLQGPEAVPANVAAASASTNTTAPAAPATTASTSDMSTTLFNIVAEKTGYPADMLEDSMHLEADLGIDSIKRVEILSALQDAEPSLQSVPADEMGALATLGDILKFFAAQIAPQPVQQAPKEAVAEAPAVQVRKEDPVHLYTTSMRKISGERNKIRLPEGGEIWVAGTGTQLERDLMRQWEGRGFRVTSLKLFKKTKKVLPEKLSGLILVGLHNDMPRQVLRNALMLLKRAAQPLRDAAKEGSAILASITEMGGHFGFQNFNVDADPQMGALAGMIKTASHEWPEVYCKAIDIASDFDQDPDYRLVEELLLEGPLEVGMLRDGAVAVQLQSRDWPNLNQETLVDLKAKPLLVTGGARGVTAATCVALANAYQPKLVLLGRSPEPADDEPQWLAGLHSEAEIKKAIITNSKKKYAPREVNDLCQTYLRAREIRLNLAQMRAAGSEVIYLQADVRETAALNHAIDSVRKQHGEIVGLLHGAGVLADRLIEEKTEAQFDSVYGTKVDALQLLLQALNVDQLKVIGLFASTTARLGRKGQVDYAMANEALNKYAQQLHSQYADTRVVSFNWGPWDGGMVTPSLAALFEAEGIGLIPIQKGAELVAREFSQPANAPREIVVLAGEPLHTGNDDKGEMHIVHRMDVTVEDVPVLSSHVLNERAVVPMALSIEWLAQIALAEHAGYKFVGFDNLQVLKGMTIAADRKLSLAIEASEGQRREDGNLAIDMLITSQDGAKTLRHVRATILLNDSYPAATAPTLGQPGETYSKGMAEVYDMLFHGKMLQGIEAIETYSDEGLTARIQPAPAASNWWREPLRNSWLCDPMFMDGAFQTMVLWCIERFGVPSLPSSSARFRMYSKFPKEAVNFTVRIMGIRGQMVDAAMEFVDSSGQLLARLEGYSCVMDSSLNKAFRRNYLPETARA